MEVFHRSRLPEGTHQLVGDETGHWPSLQDLCQEIRNKHHRLAGRWPNNALDWLDNLPALHRHDICKQLQDAVDAGLEALVMLPEGLTVLVEHPVKYHVDAQTHFSLRLDLAHNDANNDWHLVDYKAYGANRFTSANMATLQKHMSHALSSFAFDPATYQTAAHREHFMPETTYPLIYQLPLYWLAMSQQAHTLPQPADLKSVQSFSLQILRSPSVGASIKVTMAKTPDLEATLIQFAEHLKHWVDKGVRQVERFDPAPDNMLCNHCTWQTICPKSADDAAYAG
jgi:hypothetical protein